MEYQIIEQNQIAYNIISLLKDNNHLIPDANIELHNSIIDALSLTNEELQLKALLMFAGIYNKIFNMPEDRKEELYEKHKELTIQISTQWAKTELKDNCTINNKAVAFNNIPDNKSLILFLGVPLFIKNRSAYSLAGEIAYLDIEEEIRSLGEPVYVIGKVSKDFFEFTD